jgi:hypothetical protein
MQCGRSDGGEIPSSMFEPQELGLWGLSEEIRRLNF